MQIPVNYITIEGPDLAGKTTLYAGIHRSTGFLWNIQDRSALSMLCYARLYGRDPVRWREQLREEINCLNNRVIVLIPSEETTLRRLQERGDEFQTETSILQLRRIFEEETTQICAFPNVHVVRTEMGLQDIVDNAVSWVKSSISRTPGTLAADIRDHAAASGGETYRLSVHAHLGMGYPHRSEACLNVEEEREYYVRIRTAFLHKIRQEIAGENEQRIHQHERSRRFVHAEDTCISFLHTMIRNRKFQMSATLRSSNVSRTLPHDLDFLYLLTSDAHSLIGASQGIESDLHLSIQSAHINP